MSSPVRPLAYTFGNCPLPFSRSTWFRWERQGIIPPMLRIGSKTLLQATTIDGLISGKIVPPASAGRLNPPKHHEGAARGGRPRKRSPKPSAASAAE
jgi:hypothetical protein